MKQKEKISVIIPVYNVEKYIGKCIDSVLAQTIDNLEIILVDDGSKDNSGEICEEYVRKDTRIHVIHKENGGLSDARNEGFKVSTGEYIIFIDSDDYIAEDMLETLMTNIQQADADMSTCGIYNVYQDYMSVLYNKNERFTCDNLEAYKEILIGKKVPGSICNKLLKRTCIEGLEFPVGRHYEDVFYHIDLMQRVEKVCIDTRPLYYYVHRNDSITTSKYQKSSYDIVIAYQKNLKMLEEKMPQLMNEGKFRLLWAYFVVFDRILLMDKYWEIEDYPEVKRILKKSWWEVCKCPYFSRNRKIAAVLLKVNVKLYKLMTLIEHKRKNN